VEELVFVIEYCDRETGERKTKEVGERGLAHQLAKELAKASGRRAVIRQRKVDAKVWAVQKASLRSNTVELLWSGLTRQQVLLRFLAWEDDKSYLIPMPDHLKQKELRFA
jgi:hypothetical protein